MVGSGAHAHVYSYVDPDYGIKFALKRAKKELGQRDLARFKQEFEVLKRLSFPYVVEVYRYNEQRNEYRMEYCDTTLREYIKRTTPKSRAPRGSASPCSFCTGSTTFTEIAYFTATSACRTFC